MSSRIETLASRLSARFAQELRALPALPGDVAFEVDAANLLAVCKELRDNADFGFEQLIDLAGVDYLDYGREEWNTLGSTATGFSRGVNRIKETVGEPQNKRFAVTYQLLSISNNWRLRLRSFTDEGEPPVIDSVVEIWSGANWFEREAFDLYGIMFRNHPDLRRILTDYGFIGHPFRKDFPLIGNVEVKYDTNKGRVVYQPVSIEPRTLVPRVIRDDNRYDQVLKEVPVGAAASR
ncbi:NADH-quinone oxidoreductase subunit C [Steroidobacter sp. S1-65]|uniref:NADH-quinone oxidoreductase subunit C n=1 Tax=Steroidobacter gossypii TaxID=2805490 RepID=A0ABS1WW80_9GAMM|nr:NADH-quinone oxidoreductase subunit C [Steroidobacter gossypii]MBM0105230.1 NADH-quinone oxidoreductase subunit C [Steroidobacter gossypii]